MNIFNMVKIGRNKSEKINLMSIDDKQDMNFIYVETNGGGIQIFISNSSKTE